MGDGWLVGDGLLVGRGVGRTDGLGVGEWLGAGEWLGLGLGVGLAVGVWLGLAAVVRGEDAIAGASDDSGAAGLVTSDLLAGETELGALPSRWLLVQPAAVRPMITLTASIAVRPAGVSCARLPTGSG
ncbi:MAG TPA: hypothetical protein VII50_02720 [Acidothermaceae bacterium]